MLEQPLNRTKALQLEHHEKNPEGHLGAVSPGLEEALPFLSALTQDTVLISTLTAHPLSLRKSAGHISTGAAGTNKPILGWGLTKRFRPRSTQQGQCWAEGHYLLATRPPSLSTGSQGVMGSHGGRGQVGCWAETVSRQVCWTLKPLCPLGMKEVQLCHFRSHQPVQKQDSLFLDPKLRQRQPFQMNSRVGVSWQSQVRGSS